MRTPHYIRRTALLPDKRAKGDSPIFADHRRPSLRDGARMVPAKIGTVPWIAIALVVCISFAPVFGDDLGQQKTQDDTAIETELKQTVEYLAGDDLQGRGAGTEGIEKAADYIAKRMGKIGLKTDQIEGGPYQTFPAWIMHYEDQADASKPNMLEYLRNRIYDVFAKSDDASTKNQSTENASQTADRPVKLKNVVAMLKGEGPSAEETIVIGAHYDHLGMKKTANGESIIYHGANDNASGVAVMLEAAEILAKHEKKLPRRIVFIAFSGEESGMLGSFHYVNHPVVPLEKTIAMINLDVVGRMQGDMLITIGTCTSPMLAKITDKVTKQHELNLIEMPGVLAGSDHAPFYSCHIPVVFLLTQGGMGDMHRPTDSADKLNYRGMRQIAQITADLATALAQSDHRPEFSEEGASKTLFRNLLRLWGSMSN